VQNLSMIHLYMIYARNILGVTVHKGHGSDMPKKCIRRLYEKFLYFSFQLIKGALVLGAVGQAEELCEPGDEA